MMHFMFQSHGSRATSSILGVQQSLEGLTFSSFLAPVDYYAYDGRLETTDSELTTLHEKVCKIKEELNWDEKDDPHSGIESYQSGYEGYQSGYDSEVYEEEGITPSCKSH